MPMQISNSVLKSSGLVSGVRSRVSGLGLEGSRFRSQSLLGGQSLGFGLVGSGLVNIPGNSHDTRKFEAVQNI